MFTLWGYRKQSLAPNLVVDRECSCFLHACLGLSDSLGFKSCCSFHIGCLITTGFVIIDSNESSVFVKIFGC